MLRVGIQRKNYPEVRNILSLNNGLVDFQSVPMVSAIPQEFVAAAQVSAHFRTNMAVPQNPEMVNCFHFFNTIPLTEVPFVTTFETVTPRWFGVDDATWRMGMEILASDWCLRLFAISNNALNIQTATVLDKAPDLIDVIAGKTEVLYPPQVQGDESLIQKFSDPGPLRMAFIGGDLYTKGGLEMLRAIETLATEGADFHLHLVSDLRSRDETQAWNRNASARSREAQNIISRLPQHITHSDRLPHSNVMEILEDSHIALLPSFAETFGFAVLEAQASMCSVITTNQRAFTELNNNRIGWIIELPLAKHDNVDLRSFSEVSERCERGIEVSLREALSMNRMTLALKAYRSWERIGATHNPQVISGRLMRAYGSKDGSM